MTKKTDASTPVVLTEPPDIHQKLVERPNQDAPESEWIEKFDVLENQAREVFAKQQEIITERDLHIEKLNKKLELREKLISAFSKGAKSTGNFFSNRLRTPFLYAAYFVGGPVAASTHHLLAPKHFKDSWDHNNGGHFLWGYGIGALITVIEILGANAYDKIATTGSKYSNVVDTISESIPCQESDTGFTAGTRVCDSVFVPEIPYNMPWLPGSGSGIGPYTLHRQLETRIEKGVSDTGANGEEICTQVSVAWQLAESGTPEQILPADDTAHRREETPKYQEQGWNCNFVPN